MIENDDQNDFEQSLDARFWAARFWGHKILSRKILIRKILRQDFEPQDFEPQDFEPQDFDPQDFDPQDFEDKILSTRFRGATVLALGGSIFSNFCSIQKRVARKESKIHSQNKKLKNPATNFVQINIQDLHFFS